MPKRKALGVCVLDECRETASKRLSVKAKRQGKLIPRQLRRYVTTKAGRIDPLYCLPLCKTHYLRGYRQMGRGEPFHMLFESRRSMQGLTDDEIRWIRRVRQGDKPMPIEDIANILGVSTQTVWRRLHEDYRLEQDEGRFNPWDLVDRDAL